MCAQVEGGGFAEAEAAVAAKAVAVAVAKVSLHVRADRWSPCRVTCLQRTSHTGCSSGHVGQPNEVLLQRLSCRPVHLGVDKLWCVVQAYAGAVATVNVQGTGSATVDVLATAQGVAQVCVIGYLSMCYNVV